MCVWCADELIPQNICEDLKFSFAFGMGMCVCKCAGVYVCERVSVYFGACMCVSVCILSMRMSSCHGKAGVSALPPPLESGFLLSLQSLRLQASWPSTSWTILMSQPAISPPECGDYRQTPPHPFVYLESGDRTQPSEFQGKHFNQLSHLACTWCY